MRLFLLAAVALAPALAILTYNEVALRRSREAEVHGLALRFGQLAAQELEGIVGGISGTLSAIAKAPIVQSDDIPGCKAYLASVQADTPSISSVAVIARDGQLRCRPGVDPQPMSVADRPYFKAAMQTGRLVVGDYTESRITGRANIPIAVPIQAADGNTIGIVAASLDLDWLGAKLRGRDFTNGGALTIADRNGRIIAREPYPGRFIGTQIPDTFIDLVRADRPGSREVLSQDGTRRIIGYVPPSANGAGLYVSAGLPESTVFAALDQATRRGFLLAAAGAIAALVFAGLLGRRVIGRPVDHLVATIEAWRRGDQSARTGMTGGAGEIERVGAAIDGFMDELSIREKRQRLLVNELNHRVKNTLAAVQSIAMQTLKPNLGSPEPKQVFISRLMALSRAQDILTRSQWEGADLETVIREAIAPHRGYDRAPFSLSGPGVHLSPSMVLALALALHELCTNAAKYGAFSTPTGHVTIDWKVVISGADQRLLLTWRETGGPPVEAPAHRGFGSRLLESGLARELDGEVHLEFLLSGVVCTISAPLATSDAEPAEGSVADVAQMPPRLAAM
ncbi:sensor histidine kinase [Salinarimonas soli]|nr:sensor histidine kinase [Salinarimonas soli]